MKTGEDKYRGREEERRRKDSVTNEKVKKPGVPNAISKKKEGGGGIKKAVFI